MESLDLYHQNPVLMLRKITEYVVSGKDLSDTEKNRIIEHHQYIKKALKKDVSVEIEKMLLSDSPGKCFRYMHECKLLKYIIPQLDKCFYEQQRNKYHIYNVGEHIMHAVSAAPPVLSVRWAALLHDVGKPLCSSSDSAGTIHFYGHHIESRRIADDIMYRYNADSDLRREVCILIEYHDVHFEQTETAVKRALSRLGEQGFLRLLDLQEADIRAKNPIFIEDKCKSVNNLRQICMDVIKKGEPYRYTDLAIGKRDLIKMKYRAERQMRDVLRILFDEVIENPALNNRDYLLKRAKNLKNKH